MQRLRRMFSSQERRQQQPGGGEEYQPKRSSSSAAVEVYNENLSTSMESELFNNGPNAHNWLDDNKWTTSVEFASDPTAWEEELEKSWGKLEDLFTVKTGKNDKDALSKVYEHLSTVCKLLVMEVNSQTEPSIGPILDQFFNEEILLSAQKWALRQPQHQVQRCQIILIRIYENMVTCCQCPQSLLVHKPVLIPLLQLLQWCRKTTDERLGLQKIPKLLGTAVDRSFVRLINQICRKIAEDETLLHFFFHSSVTTPRSDSLDDENNTVKEAELAESLDDQPHSSTPSEEQQHKPFLIFDLLVPYVYAPEDVGQLARDALLLIMSASRSHQFVSDYVVQKSGFCHILAAGLSGCFSQLPTCVFTKIGLDNEESHKLNFADVKALPHLYEFHNALLFANAVAQVSHVGIVRQIAHFIYTGFLLKVFKTSIIETEPKENELCSRIIYFHLCVDTITSPALLQSFIRVLLVNEDDGNEAIPMVEDLNLLEVLLLKMQDSERLCRVTLSLVRTLLDLRCEDILWCTILRHLIPFIPLKPTGKSRRFNPDISLNASRNFIQCIPNCVRNILEICSEEQFEAFLREAGEEVREFEQSCSCWKLKYDGNMPSGLRQRLNSNSDEMLSARQPFTRFSSARSSFASTGWNRYGQSGRSGTLMDGNLDAVINLNELGEEEEIRDEDLLDAGTSSSQEDFSDTVELPNGTHLDYFHFAYEGVSESDPDSCSRRNSEEESPLEQREKQNQPGSIINGSSAPSSIRGPASEAGTAFNGHEKPSKSCLKEAILATNWSGTGQKSREHFISLLDALPFSESPTEPPNKRAKTVEENIALIEARWQYLEELRKEKAESSRKSESEPNPFRLDLNQANNDEESATTNLAKNGMNDSSSKISKGYPMIATDEKGVGVLLESLFDVLSRMPEYNFATNMQLVGVIRILLAYSQPLLTTYMLYVDSLRTKGLIKITDLVNKVKTQIDTFAANIGAEEFEQLLRRGLRHRLAKAELFERRQQQQRTNRPENAGPGSMSARSVRGTSGGGFFTATAANVTTTGREEQPQSINPCGGGGRNNYAYAAIVHAQLCQLMAAYSLQHTPAMLHNHGGGNGSLSSRMKGI